MTEGLKQQYSRALHQVSFQKAFQCPDMRFKVHNKVQNHSQCSVPVSISLAQKAPITIAERHRHCSFLSQLLLLYKVLGFEPSYCCWSSR